MDDFNWNRWTNNPGIAGRIHWNTHLPRHVHAPKLEFLDQVIERIFAQHAQAPEETARLRQGELARARAELEHVKEAIRQGILTPTTKTMLEEAERRVAECEAAVAAAQKMPAKIEPPSTSIGRYCSPGDDGGCAWDDSAGTCW